MRGVEPRTSCMPCMRSNQLSYIPLFCVIIITVYQCWCMLWPMPREIINRLTGTVRIKATISETNKLHQNSVVFRPALIAPGTIRINILSTASIEVIETVSVAMAVFIAKCGDTCFLKRERMVRR